MFYIFFLKSERKGRYVFMSDGKIIEKIYDLRVHDIYIMGIHAFYVGMQ